MFNPQRKSKVVDIFMQQKTYKFHLAKMQQIQDSTAPNSKRYQQEAEQQHYLTKLSKSKKQVRERLSTDVYKENTRLMRKLLQTDNRKQFNPQRKSNDTRHFNSYFSSKKQKQRIHHDNYTLVMRMDEKGSGIPTLKQLKRQYKQSRKFAKNCRKLPSIVRHEEQFKRKLTQPTLQSRVNSTHRLNS